MRTYCRVLSGELALGLEKLGRLKGVILVRWFESIWRDYCLHTAVCIEPIMPINLWPAVNLVATAAQRCA